VSVHAVTVHLHLVATILLVIALAVLGLKYLHLKLSVNRYMASTIWMNSQEKPTGKISDYGLIIATTIAKYPQEKALITQPSSLQNYVMDLSLSLNRDLVVLDRSQRILADTVAVNRGLKYSYDKGEIGQTLADGTIRSFIENSQDYPGGLIEVVIPIKNDKNAIIGALVISSSQIAK